MGRGKAKPAGRAGSRLAASNDQNCANGSNLKGLKGREKHTIAQKRASSRSLGEKRGIASRLRNRDAGTEAKLPQTRSTRTRASLQNGGSNETRVTDTPKRSQRRKRDVKYFEKDVSSDDEIELEQLKINSKRERYFNQGNAIYQEYDEFLKKRRKDKKLEFINIKKEPNEEVLSLAKNKDLLKYYGVPTSDQDTF